MENNKIIKLIEYLTLICTLSYFFIYNIYLVLAGITLSLFLINIDLINRIAIYIDTLLIRNKNMRKIKKSNKIKAIDCKRDKLKHKDSTFNLAERIEELGFIPSLEKNDDSEAA